MTPITYVVRPETTTYICSSGNETARKAVKEVLRLVKDRGLDPATLLISVHFMDGESKFEATGVCSE